MLWVKNNERFSVNTKLSSIIKNSTVVKSLLAEQHCHSSLIYLSLLHQQHCGKIHQATVAANIKKVEKTSSHLIHSMLYARH
jgi:hypothetical protein